MEGLVPLVQPPPLQVVLSVQAVPRVALEVPLVRSCRLTILAMPADALYTESEGYTFCFPAATPAPKLK